MDTRDKKAENDAKAMPPPPPPPRPNLLQREIECLKQCLQNAAVKTGQVYGFYADTHRLDIAKHARNPPRTLTSSLGRELEKYDQLCDILEGHLLQAIAVLQRDLRRGEQKEEALRLEAQKQTIEAPHETQSADDFLFTESIPSTSTDFVATNPRNSPTQPGAAPITARRPSAISISSLQRPSIPLKLDLSSSSLRMTAEEASGVYASGLASPVTLAPKSARPIGPNEFPEEFMATFTTPADNRPVIDLTLAETDQDHEIKNSIDPSAGDSSDKPIELDMDMDMSMNSIFGSNPEAPDGTTGVDDMFTMPGTERGALPDSHSSKVTKETDFIDLTAQDIFASLSTNSINATPNLRNPGPSVPIEAPSPASLLAAGFSQHLSASSSSENNSGNPGADQPFDMTSLADLADLSMFGTTSDFDMDAFLNMGPSGGSLGSNDGIEKVSASTEHSS